MEKINLSDHVQVEWYTIRLLRAALITISC